MSMSLAGKAFEADVKGKKIGTETDASTDLEDEGGETEFEGNCTDSTTASCHTVRFKGERFFSEDSATEDELEGVRALIHSKGSVGFRTPLPAGGIATTLATDNCCGASAWLVEPLDKSSIVVTKPCLTKEVVEEDADGESASEVDAVEQALQNAVEGFFSIATGVANRVERACSKAISLGSGSSNCDVFAQATAGCNLRPQITSGGAPEYLRLLAEDHRATLNLPDEAASNVEEAWPAQQEALSKPNTIATAAEATSNPNLSDAAAEAVASMTGSTAEAVAAYAGTTPGPPGSSSLGGPGFDSLLISMPLIQRSPRTNASTGPALAGQGSARTLSVKRRSRSRASSRASSIRSRRSRSPPPAVQTSAESEVEESAQALDVKMMQSPPGYRVAILVNGSDGDVRPMVALARALKDTHQHCVRVFTNVNMVSVPQKYGIEAVPVFCDIKAVIQKCGGMKGSFMEAVSRPAKAAAQWLKDHVGEYANLDDELEKFQPHLLIAGAMVTGPCLKYESATKVPTIPTYLTRPHLEAPVFNALINHNPPRPSFYAINEVMDKKPAGFKRTMKTSAWVLQDEPSADDLLPGGCLGELQQFLEDGPPPVAVGWGSMTAEGLPPAEMLELALRALRKTGKRAVILGGWAELDRMAQLVTTGHMPSTRNDGKELAQYAAKQVCFVSSAPHDWLLPRCCCMVHHGGVGTTQAVLRAGRPSVVTPIFADQFEHAKRIQELGAGVGFEQTLPKIKAVDLEQAIIKATKSITALTAETLGRKIRREEDVGITRAVDMIDGFLRGKLKYSNDQWIRIKGITKKTAAE